jgi:hypothetical protein
MEGEREAGRVSEKGGEGGRESEIQQICTSMRLALTYRDDEEQDREGVGDGDEGVREGRDDLPKRLEVVQKPDDPEGPNQPKNAAEDLKINYLTVALGYFE